jgi:hypothetical protein
MTEYHCKYDDLADPNTLVDHPRNHNKHPRRQLDALSAVIWGPRVDGKRDESKALGWRHAVVVSNRSGFVTMGHARKTVAIEEGELVPVVYQDFASEALERVQLAADNKIAELAEMEIELLDIEVLELEALDMPMEDFGFYKPSNETEKPKKDVNVKPVDDEGYAVFTVTVPEDSVERLIELITQIDGCMFERSKT